MSDMTEREMILHQITVQEDLAEALPEVATYCWSKLKVLRERLKALDVNEAGR